MRKILNSNFFNRNTLVVARELLGKYIIVRNEEGEKGYLITEVEAYDGPTDKGSHASKGRTPRTSVMFGAAGHMYVYFTYGMHWLLNVVTREPGYPAAVLIRGVEGLNGPAKFTKAAGIDGRYNGLLASRKNGIWFEDRGIVIQDGGIEKGPRIGIDYAGPFWAKRQWRFYLKRYPENGSARRY